MSEILRELNDTKTLLVSFFRLASEHKKITAFTIIIFMLLELLIQTIPFATKPHLPPGAVEIFNEILSAILYSTIGAYILFLSVTNLHRRNCHQPSLIKAVSFKKYIFNILKISGIYLFGVFIAGCLFALLFWLSKLLPFLDWLLLSKVVLYPLGAIAFYLFLTWTYAISICSIHVALMPCQTTLSTCKQYFLQSLKTMPRVLTFFAAQFLPVAIFLILSFPETLPMMLIWGCFYWGYVGFLYAYWFYLEHQLFEAQLTQSLAE